MVSIPISANPAGAVDAIRAIELALQRAGQSAKAFKDIDLSKPELSELQNDIQRLAGRFRDLAHIGRGATAQSFSGLVTLTHPPGALGAGGAFGPGGRVVLAHECDRILPAAGVVARAVERVAQAARSLPSP